MCAERRWAIRVDAVSQRVVLQPSEHREGVGVVPRDAVISLKGDSQRYGSVVSWCPMIADILVVLARNTPCHCNAEIA